MPAIAVSVQHGLNPLIARSLAEEAIKSAIAEHGDKVSNLVFEWLGTTFTCSFRISGFTVSGSGEVTDDSINVKGTIPIAALMYPGRAKIENSIREHLTKVLGLAKAKESGDEKRSSMDS